MTGSAADGELDHSYNETVRVVDARTGEESVITLREAVGLISRGQAYFAPTGQPGDEPRKITPLKKSRKAAPPPENPPADDPVSVLPGDEANASDAAPAGDEPQTDTD